MLSLAEPNAPDISQLRTSCVFHVRGWNRCLAADTQKERCAVIAMRRLMILGWGVEAGLRVRVIHPSNAKDQPRGSESLTVAQRAAAEAAMIERIDRIRSDAAVRWIEIGGR